MSQELPQKEKEPKSLMIAGIIIGLIVLLGLMLCSLIAILSLIAAPTLVKATDKAKSAIIKVNALSATSKTIKYFVEQEVPAQDTINKVINELNTKNTPDDKSDDTYSLYDKSLPAFSNKPGPGVVVLKAKDDKTIIITAYDQKEVPMLTRTINFDETRRSLEEAKKRVKERNQFE